LDTCGTGGDGARTFNISTAAALVAAGAGALVAKHGNRSVSSQCGSADVLAAAGVNVDGGPEIAEQCLAQLGIGFLFAPALHSGLSQVAGVRREVGIRSIFNVLGPLSNPAGASRQLLGVYSSHLVPILAQTLLQLGSERALVVHGEDGLDEISPSGPTRAAHLENGQVIALTLHPEDAGVRAVSIDSIRGGDAAHNAHLLFELLHGQRGPIRDAVVLNAAAALWVAGLAKGLREGAELAVTSLDQGKAREKLEGLVRLTGGSQWAPGDRRMGTLLLWSPVYGKILLRVGRRGLTFRQKCREVVRKRAALPEPW
jgi:anthranilate phosphoribosyltransferase